MSQFYDEDGDRGIVQGMSLEDILDWLGEDCQCEVPQCGAQRLRMDRIRELFALARAAERERCARAVESIVVPETWRVGEDELTSEGAAYEQALDHAIGVIRALDDEVPQP